MELPKTALPIPNSVDHWIDINGDVYSLDKRNQHKEKLIKKTQSTVFGYKYVGIRFINKDHNINKRVHRLVAETFIPNPNNLPVVGHKNNIKSDNRVENLYWTTIQENTQKAVDDGLLVNDKGFDDSQSQPVIMFETATNKQIGIFGSIREAAKQTNICASTIARQAKYKRPVRKEYYFRFVDDISANSNKIIGQFDYDTDILITTFGSVHEICKKTNFHNRTVNYHLKNGKPKHKFNDTYFKYLY